MKNNYCIIITKRYKGFYDNVPDELVNFFFTNNINNIDLFVTRKHYINGLKQSDNFTKSLNILNKTTNNSLIFIGENEFNFYIVKNCGTNNHDLLEQCNLIAQNEVIEQILDLEYETICGPGEINILYQNQELTAKLNQGQSIDYTWTNPECNKYIMTPWELTTFETAEDYYYENSSDIPWGY